MNRPIFILSAGGHAKVCHGALVASNQPVVGFVETDKTKHGELFCGLPIILQDDFLAEYSPEDVVLVNGLGSVNRPSLRQSVFEFFKEKGFEFANVVHPSAVVSSNATIGEGSQVMAGCIIQPGVSIAENAIVNTKASVDHDTTIGPHSHIAPGVTISGFVDIGASCHIGVGAVIIQGMTISRGAVVGAGSVVLHDVLPDSRVAGVPANAIE